MRAWFGVVASLMLITSGARADSCYTCGSGSACNQCRYSGKDSDEARKACEKRGCKITSSAVCSTAPNVKTCNANDKTSP